MTPAVSKKKVRGIDRGCMSFSLASQNFKATFFMTYAKCVRWCGSKKMLMLSCSVDAISALQRHPSEFFHHLETFLEASLMAIDTSRVIDP